MSKITKTQEQINQLSPLIWAFAGDSIYDLKVRTHLINTTTKKPHELHLETIEFVKAGAQAKIVKHFVEQNILSEDEQDILRRGRNTQNYHNPKNASTEEYMLSTAFEALLGYLYLTGNMQRVENLIDLSIDFIEKDRESKEDK